MDDKIPLDINIHIADRNGTPVIELRKHIVKPLLIKEVIQAAYHESPIIIYPKFNNLHQAIAALTQKGILYYDADKKQYFFNI